jgi:hypothetical protein
VTGGRRPRDNPGRVGKNLATRGSDPASFARWKRERAREGEKDHHEPTEGFRVQPP